MINAHSIKTTLLLAVTQLKAQGSEGETAKLEAQLLLQYALNVNRAWLIAHENDDLEPNMHAAYLAIINRRINGEPIAYILGYREFYGLKLKVTPDTLIPRADTETLIDAALAKIALLSLQRSDSILNKNKKLESKVNHLNIINTREFIDDKAQPALKILDLGTGSGAIALAIAKHAPNTLVIAADASKAALDIASENAKNLTLYNVEFVFSNWFSEFQQDKFDVIVSNPPYIEADDDHLNQGDLRYEPISALASGQYGLDDIRKIITQAPHYLKSQGWLLLEHGYNQASTVALLLTQAGFTDIEHAKDLAGINRVTLGRV